MKGGSLAKKGERRVEGDPDHSFKEEKEKTVITQGGGGKKNNGSIGKRECGPSTRTFRVISKGEEKGERRTISTSIWRKKREKGA